MNGSQWRTCEHKSFCIFYHMGEKETGKQMRQNNKKEKAHIPQAKARQP